MKFFSLDPYLEITKRIVNEQGDETDTIAEVMINCLYL